MKNEQEIPCNFKIPKGYRRTFYLEDGEDKMRITISKEKGMRLEQFGPNTGNTSLKLDWIEESIERIRFEVGA